MRRRSFPAPAYRYMLNVEIVDYTESRYVSLFNDEAERLLGIKAEELNALQLSNSEAFERVFQSALLKEYVMTLRVKVREGEGRDGVVGFEQRELRAARALHRLPLRACRREQGGGQPDHHHRASVSVNYTDSCWNKHRVSY